MNGVCLPELQQSGYRVTLLEGDKLYVVPTPPPEVVDQIRQYKPALIAELQSQQMLDYWLPLVREAPTDGGLLDTLRRFRDHGYDWTAEVQAQILLAVLDWYLLRMDFGNADVTLLAGCVTRLPANVQAAWWQQLCENYTSSITSPMVPHKPEPLSSDDPLVEHYRKWKAADSPQTPPRTDVAMAAAMFISPGARLIDTDGSIHRLALSNG